MIDESKLELTAGNWQNMIPRQFLCFSFLYRLIYLETRLETH